MYESPAGLEKNHDSFKKIKNHDLFDLNQIFLFKLDFYIFLSMNSFSLLFIFIYS